MQRDTTAQHSMHARALSTRMQQSVHELAHLEAQKNTLQFELVRMRVDLEQMAELVEKRTFDEVEVTKQIAETDALANQVRLKHKAALGTNIEVQKSVILTEAQSQDQRVHFQRILSASTCLSDQIDISECERARLNETVQKLEQERVVLLSNNERYETMTIDLENQIKQRKLLIEKLKDQNDMLNQEMHSMVLVDEKVRRTLKGGNPGHREDYAAKVQRLKSENLRQLSHSKHQTVERKLHERYDIDGFERYRVHPRDVRPTEWPTPLRFSSKEREKGSENRGQSTG